MSDDTQTIVIILFIAIVFVAIFYMMYTSQNNLRESIKNNPEQAAKEIVDQERRAFRNLYFSRQNHNNNFGNSNFTINV